MNSDKEQQSNYTPRQDEDVKTNEARIEKISFVADASTEVDDNKTPTINLSDTPFKPSSSKTSSTDELYWKAKERSAEAKGSTWYILLGLIAVAGCLFTSLVLKDYFFTALIVVIFIAIIVFYHKPPEDVKYALTFKGLYIDDKLYDYDRFKAFALIKSGNSREIKLIPKKRFEGGVVVYFPLEKTSEITNFLSGILPLEERNPDLFDKIIRRLKL